MIKVIGKTILWSLFLVYCGAAGIIVDEVMNKIAPGMALSEAAVYIGAMFFAFIFVFQLFILKAGIYDILPYHTLPIKRWKLIIVATISKTPSVADLISVTFFGVILIKAAYNGAITGIDVALYTTVAFCISALISIVVRYLKSIGSIVVLVIAACCVMGVVYGTFETGGESIGRLIANRAVATSMVFIIPIIAAGIAKMQYRREFYSVVGGEEKKSGGITTKIGNIRTLSPYMKLLITSIVRNKTAITSGCILTIVGVFNYYVALTKVECRFNVILMGAMACGALPWMTNPVLYQMSYSFDGLQTTSDCFVKKILTKLFTLCWIVDIIPAAACALISGKYLLTASIYIFANGVIGSMSIISNRYASKRVDVFRSMSKATGIDIRVVMCNIASLLFIGIATAGYYILSEETLCYTLIGIGATGIAMHRVLIDNTSRAFMKTRYRNMAGFRGEK